MIQNMVPERFVLQMAGFSGTGKSTLARALGLRTTGVVVDIDVFKSTALDAGVGWDLAGKLAYMDAWAIADSLLDQGRSVILDSPCRFPNIVVESTTLADRHNAAYAFVECVLPDDGELGRRLRQRNRLRSQMVDVGESSPDAPAGKTAAALVEAGGQAVLETKYPDHPWLQIDTRKDAEECLALALAYLDDLARSSDGGRRTDLGSRGNRARTARPNC